MKKLVLVVAVLARLEAAAFRVAEGASEHSEVQISTKNSEEPMVHAYPEKNGISVGELRRCAPETDLI